MNIEEVWSNIVKNEGKKFYTVTRIEFWYVLIDATTIQPHNVKGSKLYPIKRDTLETVISECLPLVYKQISKRFYAPAYIYALLIDKRII